MVSSKKNIDIDNSVDKYSVTLLCFLLECLFTKTVKITRNNILENRLLNLETSIANGQH